MPRPRTGTIRRKPTRLGTSYGLRFTYRGQEIYHHFGGSWDGWTEERAEDERAYVMQQVERGEFVAQRRRPSAPDPAGEEIPTFQELASIFLARKEGRVAPKAYDDLKWRLTTAMRHFGPYRVDEIDEVAIDDFVTAKLQERGAIEEAAAAGKPLTETYFDRRTGREHRRRRRGLSNGSINKVVAGVRQVLKYAKRRQLIEHNPADDRDCYLRVSRPRRSFLEVPQILALFEAARQLEHERRGLTKRDVLAIRASAAPAVRLAREYGVSDTLIRKVRRGQVWANGPERRRNDVTRLAPLQALVLGGPRVSELCGLNGQGMDFARRLIHIPRSKTDASERSVPMVASLHETLLGHRGDYRYRPDEPVFATRNGTRNTPDNVRGRILAPIHARANVTLEAEGLATIGRLTPHTLRRTFASLLAEVGVSPRRAMYLLGHTDPGLTMRVYQQVLDMGGAAPKLLEQVLGCTVEEAFLTWSGREVSGPKPDPHQKTVSEAGRNTALRTPETPR